MEVVINLLVGCGGSLLAAFVLYLTSYVPMVNKFPQRLFFWIKQRMPPPALPEGEKIINNTKIYVDRISRDVAWVNVTISEAGKETKHPTIMIYQNGEWVWRFARDWMDNGEVWSYINGR